MRVILHIVFDGVFFDRVSDRFDEMEGYRNIYLLRSFGETKPFSFIKNVDKVVIAKTEEEWSKVIGDEKVDIIYFHGIWTESLQSFKYVNPKAIVIWWCYGKEIYENCWGLPPLLRLKLLKPRTFWFIQKKYCGNIKNFVSFNLVYFLPSLYAILKKMKKSMRERIDLRDRMLQRVDYLFTPLPIEYDALKEQHKLLKARPFRLPTNSQPDLKPIIHSQPGGVLLDHSAMLTNNHLDLLYALKNVSFSSRKMFVPLSYGNDVVREEVKKYVNYNGANTLFLEESIPFEDYKDMLRSCSHAIFGPIRQSALGNIYLCLQLGVKVFLFKESILYKHFKKEGYFVFSIDSDLSQDSIETPLTEKEALYNNNLFNVKMCKPYKVSDADLFNELIERHANEKINI